MRKAITDTRGYKLVFVGKEHHLADVRGYAYKHRLIAEQMLGRQLKRGEEVHHDDDNPSNNRRRNLIITRNHATHLAQHRTRTDKRQPGDRNPTIKCACGCGRTMKKFDRFYRPRRFLPGCSWRKGTGKKNESTTIACACGCGEQLKKYDRFGRTRQFITGHNRRKNDK